MKFGLNQKVQIHGFGWHPLEGATGINLGESGGGGSIPYYIRLHQMVISPMVAGVYQNFMVTSSDGFSTAKR